MHYTGTQGCCDKASELKLVQPGAKNSHTTMHNGIQNSISQWGVSWYESLCTLFSDR